MKTSYMVRYACKDLWHSSNRPFSIMNIVAISISVAILVLLTGGFLSFRKNSDKLISGRELKIEVSAREEGEIPADKKKKLSRLIQGASVYWWTPTVLIFYNGKGRLKGGIGGQTVDLGDPLLDSLKDMRQQPVEFLGKKRLSTHYDELGLVVPFSMLKQLCYLPDYASQSRPGTWITIVDFEKLKKEMDTDRDGEITENEWKDERFLNVFDDMDANHDKKLSKQEWLNGPQDIYVEYFFKKLDGNRDGKIAKKEWKNARPEKMEKFLLHLQRGYAPFFTLNTADPDVVFTMIDQNRDGEASREEIYSLHFPKRLKIRIPDTPPVDIEIPVVGVIPDSAQSRYLLTKDCYHLLSKGWKKQYRSFLVDRDGKKLFPGSTASGKNPIPEKFPGHAETHASVYVKKRSQLLPAIDKIRMLGLKVDCPLENYLEKYQQQETFFIMAAGLICLALFFFAGVVLFANFHSLILRKFSEIGILKACGVSREKIKKMFSLQSAILCFISIGTGIGGGLKAGSFISRYIQHELKKGNLPKLAKLEWFQMPTGYIVLIFAFGMLFGYLVTSFPVRTAVSVDPDQVIRV